MLTWLDNNNVTIDELLRLNLDNLNPKAYEKPDLTFIKQKDIMEALS